jgi:prepilin-type N-terminal cleavage/methylation domain-containing protein
MSPLTTKRNGQARGGYTLLEMTVVMAVMAVASMLIAPALVNFGGRPAAGSADKLLSLLHDARASAIEHDAIVTVLVDPKSGKYEVDTTGVAGAVVLDTGTVELEASASLVTNQPRLRYVFQPTGAAFADSVLVAGGARTLWVGVDAWSGVANAIPR